MSVYLSNLNDKMKDTNTTLGQISTELGLLAISNAGDLNDPTTMARLVRAGLGETAYPVGSQVTVTHSVYGDLVFDVAAHNFHKKTGDENAPTMTLLMHDTIPDISFDAAELLWANTTGKALPAGTYHFYQSSQRKGCNHLSPRYTGKTSFSVFQHGMPTIRTHSATMQLQATTQKRIVSFLRLLICLCLYCTEHFLFEQTLFLWIHCAVIAIALLT